MPIASNHAVHDHWLDRAARVAVRGHGGAEPNPLVGCVIVDDDGALVAEGAHTRYGGPHAEVVALRRAGACARGATAYVTLEPCGHTGKTPPCAEALIEAGVRRVVYAVPDRHPPAAGGATRLAAAGLEVVARHDHGAAQRVTAPFVHRMRTGRPWVVAKWAQTLDGRIATRTGASQWISSSCSRSMVHRERGRVDVILTGIGTVRSDDPLLTARNVRRRRIARRLVVDPRLETPLDAQLVQTARETPTTIACRSDAALPDKTSRFEKAGVEIMVIDGDADGGPGVMPLALLLERLASDHDAAHVLVEAGPGLIGHLFRQQLVNQAWVFVAPLVFGDEDAIGAVTGHVAPALADGHRLRLADQRTRGGDAMLLYDVVQPSP